MIDPNTSTVTQVQDYLDQHPEDLEAVQAAEADGKARVGVLDYVPSGPEAEAAALPEYAEPVTEAPSGQWERLEEGGEPVTVDGQEVRVKYPKPRLDLRGQDADRPEAQE